jgi:hypothetical protein
VTPTYILSSLSIVLKGVILADLFRSLGYRDLSMRVTLNTRHSKTPRISVFLLGNSIASHTLPRTIRTDNFVSAC